MGKMFSLRQWPGWCLNPSGAPIENILSKPLKHSIVERILVFTR